MLQLSKANWKQPLYYYEVWWHKNDSQTHLGGSVSETHLMNLVKVILKENQTLKPSIGL